MFLRFIVIFPSIHPYKYNLLICIYALKNIVYYIKMETKLKFNYKQEYLLIIIIIKMIIHCFIGIKFSLLLISLYFFILFYSLSEIILYIIYFLFMQFSFYFFRFDFINLFLHFYFFSGILFVLSYFLLFVHSFFLYLYF